MTKREFDMEGGRHSIRRASRQLLRAVLAVSIVAALTPSLLLSSALDVIGAAPVVAEQPSGLSPAQSAAVQRWLQEGGATVQGEQTSDVGVPDEPVDVTAFDAADIDTQPRFEPNAGRFDDAVDLVMPAGDGLVSIGDGIVTVESPADGVGEAVTLTFVGADDAVEPTLDDETGPITNFFIGDDPEAWLTDVRPAGAVEYSDLIGTTDVRFLAVDDGFRFDVQIEPGTDPATVVIDAGSADPQILADGRLEITTVLGAPLTLSAPVAFQDTPTGRQFVEVEFALLGNQTFGFGVGDYDESLPLVIDPTLDLSTFVGGSGGDRYFDVELTASGDVVAVGSTSSSNYVTTGGAYDQTLDGTGDVVVTKLSQDGSGIVWSTYLGGANIDEGRSVEIAADGSIYVAGYTTSPDFPTTAGAYDSTILGASDAVVFQLSSLGTTLQASTHVGGNESDFSRRMTLDSNGDVVLGVNTGSVDFPVTVGAYDTVKSDGSGVNDPALAHLSADLTTLNWATFLGGNGDDYLLGLDLDSSDRVYALIGTADTGLTTSASAYDATHNGSDDMWIGRLDAAAITLEYATYLGGTGNDGASGALTVESASRVHVAGSASLGFPTTANAAFPNASGADTAYALLDPTQTGASQLVHGTLLGGTSNGYAEGLAVDPDGRAYVVGDNGSAGLATADAIQTTYGGAFDAFVTVIDPDTGTRDFATYLGGSNTDIARAAVLDGAGDLVVVGATGSSDFPTTVGAYQTTYGGSEDGFVARIGAIPTPVTPDPVVLDGVQSGTTILPNGSSSIAVMIDTVDPAKSFLTFGIRGNDGNPTHILVRGQLTDATTLTFQRSGTTDDVEIEWSVTEFVSGVTVQRGTTELSSATENVAIGSADTQRSFPLVGMSVNGTVYGDNDNVRAELTSSTNLRLTTRGATNQNFVDWQVVTYNDSAVQSGTVALGTADASVTATIAAVDTTKSWLVYSADGDNGTSNDIGQKLVRGQITDATTLTFDRSNTGQAMTISWHLIEFTDATTVQHASANFPTSTTIVDVPISPVEAGRSIAVGGDRGFGGRTSYAADDNPGAGWFTTRLTSSTNLRIQRALAPAPADIGWFVINWPCGDSDGDGLTDCEEDANTDADSDPGTNPGPDTDGDTLPNYLDDDDDGDGVPTASENADPNGDNDPRDALDSDRDGQPDYLDIEAGPSSTPVVSESKIANITDASGELLGDGDWFGAGLSSVGDIDGDGVVDLAVSAPRDDDGGLDRGAIYILFMNPDGTMREEQKISDLSGGFTPTGRNDYDYLQAVAGLGDLDGDGVPDIAVGSWFDDGGGVDRGAVFVLFLNPDGSVKSQHKIASGSGDLTNPLVDNDEFGTAIAGPGDLDGDGIPDMVVGAPGDDDGGSARGAVYVLFLNIDGTVRADQKISDTAGGLVATPALGEQFGTAVAGLGDIDGDGLVDIAVGATERDVAAGDGRGAVYVLRLNGNGTVKGEQVIADGLGGLALTVAADDRFGVSVAGLGDIDGNGVGDLAVGIGGRDDGGADRGAVVLLQLGATGLVVDESLISSTSGGFTGPLADFDRFGEVTSLGDLDGDGTLDLAVSAFLADDGGGDRGAVWVIDLSINPCVGDSDGDGLWDCEEDGNTDADGDPATNPGPDTDGDTLPNYLDADDDDDGVPTASEDADPNGDGDPRDALDSDRDGQPDYLDTEAGPSSTPVVDEQKISSTQGGFTGPLSDNNRFGSGVASVGDIDGDGVADLVVGATDAAFVLFMNADGTVRAEQEISDTAGGVVSSFASFNGAVGPLGDIDGDGVADLVVGLGFDDDGGTNRGAVLVLFLNADGTVKAEQKISDLEGGLSAALDNSDFFGIAVAGVGDVDGDGVGDLVVGAVSDDDGGSTRGAVYVLFLNADGTVKAEQKISDLEGGLSAALDDFDVFGSAVAGLGDIDGDGVVDIGVGAPQDQTGGAFNSGSAYVLFLNADGTVKAEQKLSNDEGGLAPNDSDDFFGWSIAGLGDIDGDGVDDVAVGSERGGLDSRGRLHLLLLNADGTVKAQQQIDASAGGLAGPIDISDLFSLSVAGLGDLDGDGTLNLAIGASGDDDGGSNRGAVYVLDLSVYRPPFEVNSTGDLPDLTPGDGICDTGVDLPGPADECTLRAALEEANGAGFGEISFDIPINDSGYDVAGSWRIAPTTSLPRVTASVTIDGTTQSGFAGDPLIELADGANVSTGLEVDGGSSMVRGLSITGFQSGLRVGGSGTVVQSNWVGTRPDGTELGNFYGIVVDGGSGATIGGAGPGEGNVIARAFTSGIRLATGSSVVQGNAVGRRPDGVVTLMDVGIEVDSSGNLIGGTAPGEGNEITGSTERAASKGIRVDAGSGNSIMGNTIFGNMQNIDLGADGRSPNDALDVDAGANDLLNTPDLTITATTPLGGGTNSVDLDVSLDVPAGNYRIELFDGAAPGLGGEGGAEALVHSFTVTHPGGGAQVFAATYTGPDPRFLSATATEDFGASNYGSTSELSTVTGAFTGTIVVNSTANGADSSVGDGVCDTGGTNSEGATECSLRAAIEEANRGRAVTIAFDLPSTEGGYVAMDGYWRLDVTTLERLLSDGITIDGASQPGYDGSRPLVFVADDLTGIDLFTLYGSEQTLRALAIGFPGDDSIQLEGDRSLIDSVWIGLDPAEGYAGSTSPNKEGIIVYDGSLDGVVTNSRIANFDSGIISNSGNMGLTISDTEISGNGNGGVIFGNGGRITLLGNSIADNVGLGFELGSIDGIPLPNDVGDGDTGPNNLLNKPVLTSTTLGAGTVDVDYTIDVPTGTYRIEFFDSDRPDPTGFGEGQTFLSAETIVHPGGSANYNATVVAAEGDVITANATPDLGGGSYGGTSEFSNAALIGVVFVNSTGDASDLALGDGVCDTGALNADGYTECTLRAAVQEANASTDVDIIHFQIPETDPGFVAGSPGSWTIAPTTVLPVLSGVTVVDASSQPAWDGSPLIRLDGAAVTPAGSDGFVVSNNDVAIRGLSITNWIDDGAQTNRSGTIFSANWFGVAPNGTVAPNGGSDMLLYGLADGVVVGGPAETDGNVFGAGGIDDGLLLTDNITNTLIQNNRFGVAADGVTSLSAAGELLTVVDNAAGTTVTDNQFGASPSAAIVLINDATSTVIRSNTFGTDASSTVSLPVAQAVYASASGPTIFGGPNPGDGNTIRNADFQGVSVADTNTGAFTFLGNSVAGSGLLGFELSTDGATPNDPGDADSGPNGLLNFPEIVDATERAGTIEIIFDLDVPAGTYRIEAFSNPSGADPTGFGEGEVFLGATTVTSSGAGTEQFSMTVSGNAGDVISMTTTEDLGGGAFGATSEFSSTSTVGASPVVLDISERLTDMSGIGGIDLTTPVAGVGGRGIDVQGGSQRLVGPATDITSSALTVSAWVELDSFGIDPRIVSKGAGANAIYEVFVDNGTGEAVARFDIGGAVREVRGGTITVGTFHQIVAAWDGATVRLFVDGVEVDTIAAAGALTIDLSEPLVIGNTSSGSFGLDGTIDQVELLHRSVSSTEVLARYRNGSNSATVAVGAVQTSSAAPWTTSIAQARSGVSSLAAPTTSVGADAWITAIGIDEPGVEVSAWWWVSDPATSEVAAGTRTGTAATDQFDAQGSAPGFALGVIEGANQSNVDTDPTTLVAGSWQRVVMSTDELGTTTFSVDGVTLLGPNTLSGAISGSIGFRAGEIGSGQQWFIDDVVLRRLVSDEPTTSLGPVERN